MKVLFFTSTEEDYLSDSLLIGFRRLFGSNCVDYPKRDILYKGCNSDSLRLVRGYGFTLYSGLLEDIEVDRFHIRPKLERKYYDLVVFSDIWRQFGYYLQFTSHIDPCKTIFLDGQDTPQVYPYAGPWIRNRQLWLVARVNDYSLYFKREFTPNSQFNWWHRLLPEDLRKNLPLPKNTLPIAFSIPDEKIVEELPSKSKLFPQHIVDEEVACHVSGRSSDYAFASEAEYYADLQASKFGITTKRAGWDCLRHYEIAANGTVPCFRDLDKKPITCAPHGLNEQNSISYRNYNDLMQKIERISDSEYENLQKNALKWARENTTLARAKQVLDAFETFKKKKNNELFRLSKK